MDGAKLTSAEHFPRNIEELLACMQPAVVSAPRKDEHMCFPISGVLEKKSAGKNRSHFSNTIHEAILQTEYHPKLPTYLGIGGRPKLS